MKESIGSTTAYSAGVILPTCGSMGWAIKAAARLNYPNGQCVFPHDTVYVVNFGSQPLHRMSAKGEVTMLAGEVSMHKLLKLAPAFHPQLWARGLPRLLCIS